MSFFPRIMNKPKPYGEGRLVYPDNRIEMPELMIPGKKPIGLLEVDWNSQMTKHLEHIWGLGVNIGSCLKDKVGGLDGVNSGLTINQGSLYSTATANHATVGDTASFGYHKNDRRWTAVCQFKLDDYTADSADPIIASTYSSSEYGISIYYDNRNVIGNLKRLTFYMAVGDPGDPVALYYDGVVHDNNMHTYILRSNGMAAGNTSDLWTDGVHIGSATSSWNPVETTSNMSRPVQLLNLNSTLNFNGTVPLIMLFGEAIPDTICRSLSADPYQFLEPA